MYRNENISNPEGVYEINYKVGTEITIKKQGYLDAYYYSEPSENINIGLLNSEVISDKNERTYQCKLESECNMEVTKDGVTYFWDSCSNPNYEP